MKRVYWAWMIGAVVVIAGCDNFFGCDSVGLSKQDHSVMGPSVPSPSPSPSPEPHDHGHQHHGVEK